MVRNVFDLDVPLERKHTVKAILEGSVKDEYTFNDGEKAPNYVELKAAYLKAQIQLESKDRELEAVAQKAANAKVEADAAKKTRDTTIKNWLEQYDLKKAEAKTAAWFKQGLLREREDMKKARKTILTFKEDADRMRREQDEVNDEIAELRIQYQAT